MQNSSSDFKMTSNDWTAWSPNLKDLAPDTDAFDKELDLLDLSDLLTLPTDYNLGVNTELFTEIRGGYAPGPTSAITSSDSLNSCDTFDTLSAYSASDSLQAYAGLSNLSEVLQSFDFCTLELTEPSTPIVVESVVDQQLRLLMEQQMEQQPSLNPITTVYPPASSHPSLTSTPVQLPTLPESFTNAATTTHTSISPLDDPAERSSGGEQDSRKKYTCPKCDRRFARAFNLKTHIATHDPNRVKSFKCRHAGCGRSFSRKHDLGRHLISIHQDHDGPDAKPAIGINAKSSSKSQRVWCDSCGRGWVKGSGQECECSADETSSVGEHS